MNKQYTIDDLRNIIVTLRGENGCPWDRVQTHQSLKKDMIEECYEAIDALDNGSDHDFANELGDVLLQVVFHSRLAEERGAFTFDDVLNEICTKLITRHTHVFGKDKAVTAEEALGNWEKNKKKEKHLDTYTAMLKDVPSYLPALMRSAKVQKKAAAAGFDWDSTDGIYDKISEETEELKEAVRTGEGLEEEYGDLLVPAEYKTADGVALGQWIVMERMIRRGVVKGRLTDEQIEKLDALGMRWEKLNDARWDTFYRHALEYQKEHGNLNVKLKYRSPDGYLLGEAVCNLRKSRKKGEGVMLNDERIALLDELGMRWGSRTSWEYCFPAAEKYYAEHGDLKVPISHVDSDGVRLHNWFESIRNGTVELTEEQREKLAEMGFVCRRFTSAGNLGRKAAPGQRNSLGEEL